MKKFDSDIRAVLRDRTASALKVDPVTIRAVVPCQGRIHPGLSIITPLLSLVTEMTVAAIEDTLYLMSRGRNDLYPRGVVWTGGRAELVVGRRGPFYIKIRLDDRSLWASRRFSSDIEALIMTDGARDVR